MRKTRSAPPARRRGESLLKARRTGVDDYLVHDPEQWIAEFNGYGNGTKNPDMARIRAMRLLIQNQTFAVCDAGRYKVRVDPSVGASPYTMPPSQLSAVAEPALLAKPEMVEAPLQPTERRRTVLCLPGSSSETASSGGTSGGAQLPPPAAPCATVVEVKNMDCLEEARALLAACEPGERVAVLNMANAFTPGGGFRVGCGAQEENLHRRSDLHLFLEDARAWHTCSGEQVQLYPIPDGAVLYSRDVRVFRGPEQEGYPMLPEPFNVDVVSCPALSHPVLSSATRLSPFAEGDLRTKINSLLTACMEHGATHLVLSALGCGAFRNPPDHVAELFKEALLPPYDGAGSTRDGGFGCFKRVVFSIIDDHNAGKAHNPEGNFVPFHRCFSASSSAVASHAIGAATGGHDGS